MATFQNNQKIPNVKHTNKVSAPLKKNPPAQKKSIGFNTSQGDLGISRISSPNIPRMVKAPTRTGDSLSNHVGKVGSAMKKMGMGT